MLAYDQGKARRSAPRCPSRNALGDFRLLTSYLNYEGVVHRFRFVLGSDARHGSLAMKDFLVLSCKIEVVTPFCDILTSSLAR